MDGFRHQKSPPSERFLGLFTRPESLATSGAGAADDELDEDEVLWTGADFSAPSPTSSNAANPNPSSMLSPSSSSSSPRSFRRLPEKNFGILAALPEEDMKRTLRNPSFLQRKPSFSSSTSTSPSSSSSSARLIPAIPKPNKMEYSMSMPIGNGKIHHQSAPMNVPIAQRRERRGLEVPDVEEEADEEEMLPPHEIVARASARDSPMTTFSVLEGVGRTLKGRDLRRVRNAVWRQTGFLDLN